MEKATQSILVEDRRRGKEGCLEGPGVGFQMLGWKKALNKPAKLAERLLAPGDGEAEPGEPNPTDV